MLRKLSDTSMSSKTTGTFKLFLMGEPSVGFFEIIYESLLRIFLPMLLWDYKVERVCLPFSELKRIYLNSELINNIMKILKGWLFNCNDVVNGCELV